MILLLLQCMGTVPEVVQPIAFKAMKFNLLLCWGNCICIWLVIPVSTIGGLVYVLDLCGGWEGISGWFLVVDLVGKAPAIHGSVSHCLCH